MGLSYRRPLFTTTRPLFSLREVPVLSVYSLAEAESALVELIQRRKDRLVGRLQDMLLHTLEHGNLNGDNVVAGFWLASSFFQRFAPEPFFYVGAGPDRDAQFEGPQCLAQNVLNKGRLCGLTGEDSLTCARNPHHLLVVKGKYFPFGGGIVRRFGRIDAVVAVSGFTQEQDHDVAEQLWRDGICHELTREISDDLRLSRLPKDDARRVKYPLGIVGRPEQPAVAAPEDPWVTPLYTDGDYAPPAGFSPNGPATGDAASQKFGIPS